LHDRASVFVRVLGSTGGGTTATDRTAATAPTAYQRIEAEQIPRIHLPGDLCVWGTA